MGKTLGIYVNSDKNWKHLLGIAKAAISKGAELNLSFTYKGVKLTKNTEFKELVNS